MNRLAKCGALLLALGLIGCVPFTGGAGAMRIVAPELRIEPETAWPTVDWTLVVQRPVADKMRGSSRVVVRTDRARLAYYPGIAWLDELPAMLQSLLIEGLTDSGRTAGIVRPGGAKARYSLATEIRRFDAVEDAQGALAVELEVQATLLEVRTGRLVTSRVIDARVPVAGDAVDALTVGFEAALDTLIGELIGWTLTSAPTEPGAGTTGQPAGD